MIEINGFTASLDFILSADSNHTAIISYYDRSLSIIKSMGASLNAGGTTIYACRKKYFAADSFDVMITPIITGKDKFYHAIAVSRTLNISMMVCREGEQEYSFYNYLMHNYNLPLMKEWASAIYRWCEKRKYIKADTSMNLILGKNSISRDFPIGYDKIKLSELKAYSIFFYEGALESCIKELFNKKEIWISRVPQKQLEFSDMDSYFKKYGKSLVENLEKTIKPLTELNGNIDYFVFKNIRLFPQQAAQVNGVMELLDISTYAILNQGMGCGKTPQGAGICEGYFVRKYLKANPSKTLKDAYLEEGVINYRNIVMCPGHLVEKWAEHINREVPYARVTILNDFSQLVAIKERGIKRSGREFYIISKDFAKLSHQWKPIPKKRRFGHIMKKVCKECEEEVFIPGKVCGNCHSTNLKLVKSGYKGDGMVCPHCNNILIPYKSAKLWSYLDEDEFTMPLDFSDFTDQTNGNSRCYYCDTELWEPYVSNLGENQRSNAWYRATHYANKAHKGKKTVWVHRKFADEYFFSIGEKPLNEIDTDMYHGVRKVAPGDYIKKQLRGFFDFAIFDEAHLFKSGSSAQANCMASIISASKKHLALTGTIAGGMASHLFYLLYRLDPRRMRKAGYAWTDEIKFVEKYGVIERKYECNEDARRNSSSRGRQKGSPSQKPGISPLIFMDFLLDKTVFLDLSDMSKYLPPLKEIVDLVEIPRHIENENGDIIDNPEYQMLENYNYVIRDLKKLSRDKKGGRGILSTMLQFSLSFLDKPFGVTAIKSPKTGELLVQPKNFPQFADIENLLSKEKRLVNRVKSELSEGRNCVVYAEFTGSAETCISYRLKAILEKYCDLEGKVEVIESNYPVASKREQWMHQKAEQGIKVFITNPRNVETGLDFCFTQNGKIYNYPTLIYYQMGYSLFTIWQSSRRHYRLNQRDECRTFFMAIKYSIQEAVIGLIAEKMAATSAIQGKFSTEGLTAMANGIDAKMKLAQALSDLDSSTGSDLQSMFDVINQENFDDSKYTNYRPMLTLAELLGDDYAETKPADEMTDDLFDMFDIFDDFLSDFMTRHDDVVIDIFDQYDDGFANNEPNVPKSKKKAATVSGQMLLF